MKRLIAIVSFACCLPAAQLVWAGAEHAHEHEHAPSLQAHTHGEATLDIVSEGNHVEIMLASPAVNLVGFEHQASTPQQKQRVAAVKQQLQEPALFAFIGTACALQTTDIDLSSVQQQRDHQHHHADDHSGDSTADTHGNITASFHYQCQQGSQLKAIDVQLFHQFHAIETLNARWIIAAQQGAQALTSTSKRIRFD